MLGMRILTAAIGIPVLLLLVRAGGWLLAASLSLLGFIGWWEFCRLARAGGLKPWFWLGALGVLSWPLAAYLYSRGCPGPLLGLNVWMLIATAMGFIIYHPQRDLGDAAATLWGQLYLGGLLSHAVLMREASQGLFWVLLALVVTWSYDTAGYFAGRAWGRRHPWPRISPRKTLEGTLAGLAASTLLGVLALKLFPRWGGPLLPLGWSTALCLGLGAAAQAGDLAESALKRWAGVKDSGALIPGHGGVLDRFDSLLLVFPAVYYFWLGLAHRWC